MQLPTVPGFSSLASLAALVRQRLAEVPGLLARRPDGTVHPVVADIVIVSAAAPFAATSYARARLLRQLHASGLLTDREAEQAETLFAARLAE